MRAFGGVSAGENGGVYPSPHVLLVSRKLCHRRGERGFSVALLLRLAIVSGTTMRRRSIPLLEIVLPKRGSVRARLPAASRAECAQLPSSQKTASLKPSGPEQAPLVPLNEPRHASRDNARRGVFGCRKKAAAPRRGALSAADGGKTAASVGGNPPACVSSRVGRRASPGMFCCLGRRTRLAFLCCFRAARLAQKPCLNMQIK